jgi:tetratricopeptide (TPR) repeat protein
MSEDTEINEAELLEETEIMIKGGKSHGSAANCDIRLTSKNISWTYDTGVYYVKIFKFPLNDISLRLVPGEKGVFSNQNTKLSIIKKNNTDDRSQWNKWRIFFDYKFNSELKELFEHFKVLKEQKLKSEHYKRNEKIAHGFEKRKKYDSAIKIWKELGKEKEIKRVMTNKAQEFINKGNYFSAIDLWGQFGDKEEAERIIILKAEEREKARDYESAINIWEALGEIEEAARVRKIQAELGSVKLSQKVEIKDSVVSKSNIGSGGDDKLTKIKELKELHDAGAIDDDDFKQMKKEILGK